MNYLAHFLLSFDDFEILTGNFLGDFVTKREYELLPVKIQKGVDLHRQIDFLMDTHDISRKSKERFANHRHYASVIIDVVYDHFLAKNWNEYSTEALSVHTKKYYEMIEKNHTWLNHKSAQYFYYMKKRNWIASYSTVDGIDQILQSMARRTPYDTTMNLAVVELKSNYDELEREFLEFFPIVQSFAKDYLKS